MTDTKVQRTIDVGVKFISRFFFIELEGRMDKENNFSIVICSAEIFSIVHILENRKEREKLIILLILHVKQ